MWLFTKEGFFSAVQNRFDKGTVLLRARFSGDIERLLEKHAVSADVTNTPHADYPFRTVLKKKEWARIAAAEAEAVDYDNFKAAAHDGTDRDAGLMKCWHAMRQAGLDHSEEAGASIAHKQYRYLSRH